jgi:hypothetical protein
MRATLFLALLACALPGLAQSVATANLGALELAFERVSAGDGFAGLPLASEVTFRPGEALSLVTPSRIQQINYQVAPGEEVAPGQPIAVMAGPEIHHFLTEFEVVVQRYENARRRFERNRELYRKQAIDEARWIEISDNYYTLQLEYEHLRHFHALLRQDGSDPEEITFVAPAAGRVQYTQERPGIAEGGELALILPPGSLRLRVAVPIGDRYGLARLQHGACELPVASISRIADGFFLRAWSAPLDASCDLLPGQQLMVTPFYAVDGYEIPRQALLHWETRPAVLLHRGDQLQLVPVEILGSTPSGYYVTSDADLAGREILVTSVSAVQGVLMGLGGE